EVPRRKINAAARQGGRSLGIPGVEDVIDSAKYTVAEEIGIRIPQVGDAADWRMVPSYYCGLIGGELVKRMIQFAMAEGARGRPFLRVEQRPGRGEENVPGYPVTYQTYNAPQN